MENETKQNKSTQYQLFETAAKEYWIEHYGKGRPYSFFEWVYNYFEQSKQIADKKEADDKDEEIEPYNGWCDVNGCGKEASCGGSCWRDTGYWRTCYNHSTDFREGKPQPEMKQSAIEREKRRGEDGVLKY